MSQPRLYMFQCGVISQHWHDLMLGQRLGEPVDVPVPWYLVTHTDGHTLVDGGNPAICAVDAHRHWGEIADRCTPRMTPEQACTVELEAVGIAPADVRYIVQSHLHLDHTGALSAIAAFPNATVVATRAEFEYAHAPDWFSRALYVRADFTDPAIAWTLLEKHEDGYDVYGDGVVRLWQSPGHSPGHLAIEVTLAASGSILLAVDAVATLHHWDERALPGFATSHLEAVRSVRTLRRIAHRSQSTVVPGHDPDAWPTFKHSPHYYE